VQTGVETCVRQRNDSAGSRECLLKVFRAISINRHDVEENGIGPNEYRETAVWNVLESGPLGA
jgi:hypothetical protein